MKNSLILISFVALFFFGCSEGQSKFELAPAAFDQKMKDQPDAQLVDVRTPEEFSKGHLVQARNIDYNGDDFKGQLSQLDKSKPVLVYCLSGARSRSAAEVMRSMGFKAVYELRGGIVKWRSEGLPEAGALRGGMTKEQFADMLSAAGDKEVVVDFYADWCGPCRRMKPYLEDMAKEKSASLNVVRISADDNQDLCKQMGISSLPVVQVYKGGHMTWSFNGYVSKEDLLAHLH